jgi:hypothetical protein
MAFGRWISTATKIDKKINKYHYLAYVLLDLFDRYQLDSLYFRLEIAISMVNMAMVGYFLPNLRNEATRRQSTVIKIYGP